MLVLYKSFNTLCQVHAPFDGISLYLPLPPSAHTVTLPFPLFFNLLLLVLIYRSVYIAGERGGGESYDRKKHEILLLLLFHGLVQREGERDD
jgi:hypothetical protein